MPVLSEDEFFDEDIIIEDDEPLFAPGEREEFEMETYGTTDPKEIKKYKIAEERYGKGKHVFDRSLREALEIKDPKYQGFTKEGYKAEQIRIQKEKELEVLQNYQLEHGAKWRTNEKGEQYLDTSTYMPPLGPVAQTTGR